MNDFQIFDVAAVAMNREHQRIRQAANEVANSNRVREPFSNAVSGEDGAVAVESELASSPMSTIDSMVTIMISARAYEANVSVVAAARAAFEKALEITGRRG